MKKSNSIRKYLQEEGVTENDIASQLKVSPATIHNWATGHATPSLSQWNDLALILCTTRYYLQQPETTPIHAWGKIGKQLDNAVTGTLGLRLCGYDNAIWTPMFEDDRDGFRKNLYATNEKNPWVGFRGSKGRCYLLNSNYLNGVFFKTKDWLGLPDKYSFSIDGFPDDVYAAMWALADTPDGRFADESAFSRRYVHTCLSLFEKVGIALTPALAEDFGRTRIIMDDGSIFCVHSDYRFFSKAAIGSVSVLPRFLHLRQDFSHCPSLTVSSDRVMLIDSPIFELDKSLYHAF